ncbi:GGDEF domain-containing protein [Alkalicoccus daliensis]|uniref:Diguanylate cyclase n=1 Tax=Alkalicoccus daliensis TaxID=745820 RepID=A0A1H0FU26_9BACI|nr:diguanylate cyclase [Alkalicoccus daliensis]SDN98084.1 diguanylate cyclase [Alkalicoccus daliensis]
MLIDDLLINLCILVALIFGYQQIRWKLNVGKKSATFSFLFDGIAGGVLGIILMNYAIEVTEGTIVDLRFIPVMLLTLFISIKPAALSAAIIVIGRFLFGINISSFGAFFWIAGILLAYFIIHKKIKTRDGLYKKAVYMIIAANVIFSLIITYLVQDAAILALLLPVYWAIAFLGGLISVFLVDYQSRSNYLLQRYQKEASVDFLTGLNNVRQFDKVWNTMMQKAKEKEEQIALLMLDIDFFKKVNDTYGHPAGDKILAELGEVLKRSTRTIDIVSRNGGEEFSVILPECTTSQAVEIAERIQKAVEEHPFPVNEDKTIRLTVSIGVAAYPETVNDPEKVVQQADEYLYKAKHSGRNRVCYHNEVLSP